MTPRPPLALVGLPENRNDPAGNGVGSQNSKAGSLLVSTVPAGSVTALEARRRRDRIKLLLTSMAEQTNKVSIILEEAQTKGDHLTLGYASWPKYMVGEYAGELADLKMAQRREVVGSLTAIGMSTRAIAGVVGTSHKTVVKDLQVQVVPEVPPDPVDHQDGVDRRVTGLDGKSYTVPSRPVVEPKERRRPSLPDQYHTAIWKLDTAVRNLEKLHADDRFGRHLENFGNHHALLLELADKVGLFAIQVSADHADQVYVEMVAEGKLGGAR
jgi:hypothetical protein